MKRSILIGLAILMQLRKEILRLQGEFRFTVVYVTHSRDEASELGTRSYISNAGGLSQLIVLVKARQVFDYIWALGCASG